MHFKGMWRLSCHQKIVLRKKLIEMISIISQGVTLQTEEKPLELLLDAIQCCDEQVLQVLKDDKGITVITIVSTKGKVPSTNRDSINLRSIGLKDGIDFLYSRNNNEVVLCVDELLDIKHIEDKIKADPKKLKKHYEGCLASVIHALIRSEL